MKRLLIALMVVTAVVLGVFSYTVNRSSLDMNSTISFGPKKYTGLNEYYAYLNSGEVDLNSNFVQWEDISILGDFDYLELFLGGMYVYHFKSSEMNITLRLSVNPDEWQDNHPWTKGRIPVPFSKQMDSMRYCISDTANNNNVKIIRHGLAYRYYKGGYLSEITWVEIGVEYTLTVDGYRLPYYPDDDTIIGRLLSSSDSDVKSAVAELEAQLPGTKIQQPIPKDTISAVLVIASVLCLAAAAVLFLLEKRNILFKKKPTETP